MAFTMACPNFKKGLKMVSGPGPLGLNIRTNTITLVEATHSKFFYTTTRKDKSTPKGEICYIGKFP
jgi:hypothetical protein